MATDTLRLNQPAVSIESLTRRYGPKTVLDSITLNIHAGEFVALLGPSGCGKSTLLRALAGLDDTVEGHGRLRVPSTSSVVFQDSRLLPWETVLGNILLGSRARGAVERGRHLLAEVGLEGRGDAWPHQLSGGQQQRAALARSLMHGPELLLADEPFGALDALTRMRMHTLLRDLCRRHEPAVLLVTHDVDEALALADRVVVLKDGRIILEQRVAELPDGDPGQAARRRELLGALGVL